MTQTATLAGVSASLGVAPLCAPAPSSVIRLISIRLPGAGRALCKHGGLSRLHNTEASRRGATGKAKVVFQGQRQSAQPPHPALWLQARTIVLDRHLQSFHDPHDCVNFVPDGMGTDSLLGGRLAISEGKSLTEKLQQVTVTHHPRTCFPSGDTGHHHPALRQHHQTACHMRDSQIHTAGQRKGSWDL
ncbi:hypothetical protein SKAU_G00385650 [Synaphobranchus kaupii]|uniref:Uncharacterized protein n=1 Tax=Synaphobranchus kaupii TaxID=118154 RepID=A0A9Q1EEJ7_SYNKA|nr:hypothetical protein SKAU_G00385650 [Synaphobranchus kaupii]